VRNTGGALPKRAAIVVIGGGIQGLSVAYNLAALGERDVVVLDAGYFQGGASGRNGTLIRAGFMSNEWTGLFALANRRWMELSRRLRRNVMFSPRGYLLVAEKPATAANFDTALAIHSAHSVRSQRAAPPDLARLAPALDRARVLDAIYLPDGGVAPHHAAMDAYHRACTATGVRIRYGSSVTKILTRGARVAGVVGVSDSGGIGSGRVGGGGDFEIAADAVVLAAGAYGNAVAKLAGVELPGFPMRIEAMVLEPTRAVLRPALAFIDRLCYLAQTARGEIVGGAEVPERPIESLACDLPVMAATARVYRDMLPCLAKLRILRHWAGMLHITPDFGPLIGAHPNFANLWVSGGWSYGYAAAPAAGELLAAAIVNGVLDPRIEPFALDRFLRNRPIREGGIVLAQSGVEALVPPLGLSDHRALR
jgi:heterotetrameric sarcosine oxidase beta subunit